MDSKFNHTSFTHKYKKINPDKQTLQPLTSRNNYCLRTRHPLICPRCRRFKVKGFHGSSPPKNFCICLTSAKAQTRSISPMQVRLPSTPVKSLIAKGISVHNKFNEYSLTDTGLIKLSNILNSTKDKPVLQDRDLLKDTIGPESVVEQPVKRIFSDKLKYLVYPGNNSNLIKSVMENKHNWVEGDYLLPNDANFVWHPTSKTVKFRRLAPYLPSQIANHFENHHEITNKMNLFENLSAYCNQSSLYIYNMMPITFSLDFLSNRLNTQVSLFLNYFNSLKTEKIGKNKNNEVNLNPLPPNTHFTGNNIWILKPSGFNRGRGIQIFKNADIFKKFISTLASKSNENKKRGEKDSYTYIIQKYIESPLLINQRKFDIRVWVLVTSKLNCYFYKEGYLRTSSEDFSIDESTLLNPIIHLTNNAIQKQGNSYSKYEKGNQLSFSDFGAYFEANYSEKKGFEKIKERMKELISYTLMSVKKKLNPFNREYCFEVFGYDFIIDSDLATWLIECNTNPCIELSSPLLERLIPEMLSQAIKIAVDPVFSPSDSEKSNPTDWEYLVSLRK
jgi:Tubulin-tyrosine ligase family